MSHTSQPVFDPNEVVVFSDSMMQQMNEVVKKFPQDKEKSALIRILHIAQAEYGWVSVPVMNKIAEFLKIQAIEVKQNWMGLFLKRFTLSCKQVENSQYGQAKKGQLFIIPVLDRLQLQQAFDLCWQPCDLKAIPFVPIHSQYLRKNFTLFWLLPGLLLTTLVYFIGAGLHWILLLEFLAVGLVLCWLRYKRYGIYSDGEHAFVRSGIIGSQITAFSLYKIQQVQKTQTPMMKRLGLASLQIQLACGKLKVPYLPACLVNQFMNIALYQAESSDKNWL